MFAFLLLTLKKSGYKFLLTASQGHRKTSAIASAQAEEAIKPKVLYLASFLPANF